MILVMLFTTMSALALPSLHSPTPAYCHLLELAAAVDPVGCEHAPVAAAAQERNGVVRVAARETPRERASEQ